MTFCLRLYYLPSLLSFSLTRILNEFTSPVIFYFGACVFRGSQNGRYLPPWILSCENVKVRVLALGYNRTHVRLSYRGLEFSPTPVLFLELSYSFIRSFVGSTNWEWFSNTPLPKPLHFSYSCSASDSQRFPPLIHHHVFTYLLAPLHPLLLPFSPIWTPRKTTGIPVCLFPFVLAPTETVLSTFYDRYQRVRWNIITLRTQMKFITNYGQKFRWPSGTLSASEKRHNGCCLCSFLIGRIF